MKFADLITTRRLSLGMTQKELGDAIGISWRMIQKYEAGVAYPRAKTAGKLADVLGIDANKILTCANAHNPSAQAEQMLKDIRQLLKNKNLSKKDREKFCNKLNQIVEKQINNKGK